MITVLTPTYNRAYILKVLYDSLCCQTNLQFDWLIVDDGSTDTTQDLVRGFQEQAPFTVTYLHRENGGKHRALNAAIPHAAGEYIFIVDSDDHLTSDAIATVYGWIDSVRGQEDIAGVAGLRGTPDGKRIGDFPDGRDFVDVKNAYRCLHHLDGDKAEIYRKDLLMRYPFPEFEGERFIGEGSVWNALSLDGYRVRWFNRIIYIGEYLSDGLTAHFNHLNYDNFNGYTHNTRLNYRAFPFPYSLMVVAVYIGTAQRKGLTGREIRRRIGMGIVPYSLCLLIRRIRRMS